MPAGAQVWTLGGITFHPRGDVRDANGVQWILTKEQGFWGAPKTNAQFSARLQRHGAWRSPGWKTQRTITLTGRCYAMGYAALRRAESTVLALLSDPTTPATLTCYSEIGPLSVDVFLDADTTCTPLDVVSEPGVEFSLQVVAPDPRKYSPDWITMQASLPVDSGDGLDFLQVVSGDTGLYFGTGSGDGLVFGTSNSTGYMQLSTVGTAPSYPIFTLYGPLTNPTLTASDGNTLRYNGTLADGEYVEIDTGTPSVVFGGYDQRRQLLYPAKYESFAIPAGGMVSVGLSHSGAASATGHVQARYRTAWF